MQRALFAGLVVAGLLGFQGAGQAGVEDPQLDGGIGLGTAEPQRQSAACNVVTNQGCLPGFKCTVVDQFTGALGCGPAGALSEGASCRGDLECAAGLGCVITPTAAATCRSFCYANSDCPSASRQECTVIVQPNGVPILCAPM